ncbi:ABC-type antimicrobial peptide transport system permease subunit [Algoriphagus sp. 4150]|uniref:ABC transporter permease n=1 Tax=Algoriphagus sp. 4150 TaxID=2817756 RepID=UPI00286772AE|nr:ABC transporter permease [Algoriphagus sp. 4150]MDR7131391.1 ABC-type antimicrobial peptide transport system permease subunit [Algoriphagus sp. 4150]
MWKIYSKIAWRNLKNGKRVTLINIFGLTLGITAAFLLFTVVSYELSYDNFQSNSDRIYRVVTQDEYSDGLDYTPGVSPPMPDALKSDLSGIDAIVPVVSSSVFVSTERAVSNSGEDKFIVEDVFFTTPEYASLFDVEILAGDLQGLKEPGQVVLTETEAKKLFGTWENAFGKSVLLAKRVEATVGAIVSDIPDNSNFRFNMLASYKTLQSNEAVFDYHFDEWGSFGSNFQLYVMLPESMDESLINQQLTAFAVKNYKNRGTSKKSFFLQPMEDIHFDSRFDPITGELIRKATIYTLALIGIFILIMASINFINLSTAQAIGKSKEVGIRKVMGGSRLQVIGQSFGETFMVVFISAVISTVVATALLPFLSKVAEVPDTIKLITPSFLLFSTAIVVGVTLLSGFYPALILSGFQPIQALKNKIQVAQIGGVSLRRSLVVMQFVIAQVLMIATVIAVKQMTEIQQADLGFSKEAVYYFDIPLDEAKDGRLDVLKQRLKANSQIKTVSVSSDVPSSNNNWASNFWFDGKREDVQFMTSLKFGDADYFENYGLQFVVGNGFSESDTLKEAVINETMAKKLNLSNPEEAVGKTITIGGGEPWMTITGVVKDFAQNSLREEVKPFILATEKSQYEVLGLKLDKNAGRETLVSIEEEFKNVYPDAIYSGKFLDETIANFYRRENQLALVYKIFAVLSIVISSIGLYGLISFLVGQKLKEIGIRKVLGASVQQITFLLSKEFIYLVIIAFAIAVPLGYYLTDQWLQNFSYKTTVPIGLYVFVIVVSLVITATTVGYRAVKAALGNPVDSLADE